MSPLWPETVQLDIGPESLCLSRRGEPALSLPCGGDWEACLAALPALPRRTRLAVCVADRHVRYLRLDWPAGLKAGMADANRVQDALIAAFRVGDTGNQVLARARQRLERPTPRVALGQALRGIASSALDVSDGLLGDLNHILHASHVGASIEVATTRPLLAASHHPLLRAMASSRIDACTLAGGDDYELCFTAPPRPAQRC